MKLAEIKEILAIAVGGSDEIKPLIKLGIKAIKEYTSEVKPVIKDLSDYFVNEKIRQIKRIEEAGFSRDEAISMVNSIVRDLQAGMKKR